jgi:2-oxoisovalerate dehydrogenase E1 component
MIFAKAKEYNKIIVITEEPVNNSFAQSIAARIQEHCFESLDAPVITIGAENLPAIPLNEVLERTMLPNAQKLSRAVRKILAY